MQEVIIQASFRYLHDLNLVGCYKNEHNICLFQLKLQKKKKEGIKEERKKRKEKVRRIPLFRKNVLVKKCSGFCENIRKYKEVCKRKKRRLPSRKKMQIEWSDQKPGEILSQLKAIYLQPFQVLL